MCVTGVHCYPGLEADLSGYMEKVECSKFVSICGCHVSASGPLTEGWIHWLAQCTPASVI